MLPGESSSTDPPQQMSGAPNTEHVTYALPIGMVGFDAFSTINELTYTFDADGNLLDTSLVDQLGNNKYSGEDEASVFRPWPSDEPAFLGKQDKAVSNSPTVSPGTSASATASSHTITRPSNSPSTASPGTSVDQRDNIAPAIEVISYNLNDAQSGPQSKRRRAAKGKLNTRTKASASRGNVLQPGTVRRYPHDAAVGYMLNDD